LRLARWPSCTARRSRAMEPLPYVPWRLTTTAVFPVGRSHPEIDYAITLKH
jgi:hypothetical protein